METKFVDCDGKGVDMMRVKTAAGQAQPSVLTKKKSIWKNKSNWELLLLCLPALIGYIVFNYVPMSAALVIPFKDYKFSQGIFGSEWCGLDNFKWILTSTSMSRVLRNTILYSEDGKLYYLIAWQGLYSNVRAFKVPTELAELAGDTWLEDTQAVVDKWWNHYESTDDLQAVFDQLDIYLSALKDNGKLYGGIAQNVLGAWLYPQRFSSENSLQAYNVGVQHMDDTFTVIDAIQSDYFRVYAKNMADFYKKGYIRSDIASLETGALSFVTNGEYTPNTLVMDTHNALTDDTAEIYSAQAGTDISLIQIEEKGYLSRGDATATAIPYCADEPERAMMVLNALYTEPELYQLLIYGIEGTHYTDNGDGTITTPYGNQGQSDSDYGLWKWTIGTCKNSLVTQADTPGYYEELEEKEKDALVSSFVNFTWDDSAVADVVASLQAIDGEYKDMIDQGYTGDNWEATLDQWIAERKAAGVDRVIEDMQAQIDAYVEENNITSWISNG